MFEQSLKFSKKESPIKTLMGYDTIVLTYTVTNYLNRVIIKSQFILSCSTEDDSHIKGVLTEFSKESLDTLLNNDFSYLKVLKVDTFTEVTNTLRLLINKSLNLETLNDRAFV